MDDQRPFNRTCPLRSPHAEWLNEEGFTAKLVYITCKGGGSPTIGLELTTFNKQEPLFTVVCNGAIGTVKVGGAKKEGNSIISVITPVDMMTNEYTQQFSEGEPGIQSPNTRENGHKAALQEFFGNTVKWERSAWTATFADPSEAELPPTEIRAIR